MNARAKRAASNRDLYAFAAVIVVALAVIVISSLTGKDRDYEPLDKVIADLRSGATTQPWDDGRLELKGADSRLSMDGIAYITGRPPEYVLFPAWRGPGTRVAGLLWSSTPLKVDQEVPIMLPRTMVESEPGSSAKFSPVMVLPVRVKAEDRPGWYRVERND